MKKSHLLGAVCALAITSITALVFSTSVQAAIIDFETGSISSSGVYTEDGYSLTVNNWRGANAEITHSLYQDNPTRVFAFLAYNFDEGQNPPTPPYVTSLSLTGSSAFSISGIDTSNYDTFVTPGGTIDLIGHFVGGGSLTQTIALSNSWSSSSLTGLNNLSSLDLIIYCPSYDGCMLAGQIDNLILTQVPIPPALWLFGSGLLGFIGVVRRKKA